MVQTMTPEQRTMQQRIIERLGVARTFDAQHEADRRIQFLADYLAQAGLTTLVLGISGGVDSLAAGLLARHAVARLKRQGGSHVRFIAMRLPYGRQHDEADAQACIDVIQPDQVLVADVQPATDAIMTELVNAGLTFSSAVQQDFVLGNIKARQRMVAQFAVAGAQAGLVVGSDHGAEALVGFFTKFGDGAADVMPLGGLNKRRVRALASFLGAPETLVNKVPTADLESMTPMRPDEDAFGVTYADIDDFLEGKSISPQAFQVILKHWQVSGHKRALPVTPSLLS